MVTGTFYVTLIASQYYANIYNIVTKEQYINTRTCTIKLKIPM